MSEQYDDPGENEFGGEGAYDPNDDPNMNSMMQDNDYQQYNDEGMMQGDPNNDMDPGMLVNPEDMMQNDPNEHDFQNNQQNEDNTPAIPQNEEEIDQGMLVQPDDFNDNQDQNDMMMNQNDEMMMMQADDQQAPPPDDDQGIQQNETENIQPEVSMMQQQPEEEPKPEENTPENIKQEEQLITNEEQVNEPQLDNMEPPQNKMDDQMLPNDDDDQANMMQQPEESEQGGQEESQIQPQNEQDDHPAQNLMSNFANALLSAGEDDQQTNNPEDNQESMIQQEPEGAPELAEKTIDNSETAPPPDYDDMNAMTQPPEGQGNEQENMVATNDQDGMTGPPQDENDDQINMTQPEEQESAVAPPEEDQTNMTQPPEEDDQTNMTQPPEEDDQNNMTQPPEEQPAEEPEQPPEDGMNVQDVDIPVLLPSEVPRKRLSHPFDMQEEQSLSQLPPLMTSPTLDAECKRLVHNYQKYGRIPHPDDRAKVIQYIQREKINSLVCNHFDQAAKFQQLTIELQQAFQDFDAKERGKVRQTELENKLEDTKKALTEITKETGYLIKEENERQHARRLELKAKHEEELDVFEDHWNDSEFLKKFAKPSSYLLQLKNMERSMVLTKMFDQAEILHKKVHDLEKEESEVAQQRAYGEMDKERRKILARQEIEKENFEAHCNRNISIIKHNQEMKQSSFQARLIKLEGELDMIKTNKGTILPPVERSSLIEKANSTMTPRTCQRYSCYKKVIKQPQIKVKPLGNVNPKRSKTSQSMRRKKSDL